MVQGLKIVAEEVAAIDGRLLESPFVVFEIASGGGEEEEEEAQKSSVFWVLRKVDSAEGTVQEILSVMPHSISGVANAKMLIGEEFWEEVEQEMVKEVGRHGGFAGLLLKVDAEQGMLKGETAELKAVDVKGDGSKTGFRLVELIIHAFLDAPLDPFAVLFLTAALSRILFVGKLSEETEPPHVEHVVGSVSAKSIKGV